MVRKRINKDSQHSPSHSLSLRIRTSHRRLRAYPQFHLREEKTIRLTNILVTAVQYGLVASHVLANAGKCLNYPQAQLLPLHILANGDILDMSDASKSTKEFLLDEDGTAGHHSVGSLLYNGDSVVCLRFWFWGEQRFEVGLVGFEARVRDF